MSRLSGAVSGVLPIAGSVLAFAAMLALAGCDNQQAVADSLACAAAEAPGVLAAAESDQNDTHKAIGAVESVVVVGGSVAPCARLPAELSAK